MSEETNPPRASQGATSKNAAGEAEPSGVGELVATLVKKLDEAGRLECETGINVDIVAEDGRVILTANDMCIARDALTSLAEAEARERWWKAEAEAGYGFHDQLQKAEAERNALREALRPFAEAFDLAEFPDILSAAEWKLVRNATSIADYRRARAALSEAAR